MSVPPNPMKSTWRRADRSQWTFFHWFIEGLNIHHVDLNKDIPIHNKNDKVPYLPEWQQHRFILLHAVLPIAIQQFWVMWSGRNLNPFAAFALYNIAFKLTGICAIYPLRGLAHKVGFLDDDAHERDGVPDASVSKVAHSLSLTTTLRALITIFLSYRTSQPPSTINWYWLPVDLGLYGIVLDFWFYWYTADARGDMALEVPPHLPSDQASQPSSHSLRRL